jgi:phosphate ABC transporter phosphate-binding protein
MIGDPKSYAVSREQFLQNLMDSGLSIVGELHRILGSTTETGDADGESLARQLVRGNELTAFQANAVLEGTYADLRIGSYEVLDLLGKGAMGTVYKARHRTMKRMVAIKVLAPDVARRSTFAQRFQREVETLAQLSHVNIIMAFDAGEAPAGPFLVMEFVQGRDLASEVKATGPLSVADAVDCVLQAARGLEYAHDRGLIHRDIKPANLMRDARGVVKVADLGLARIRTAHAVETESVLTQAGGMVGTVDYMAPEQAVDSTTVDHRADIYSLGCTIFYLMTGRPLYSGSSLMALLLQHREAPPPSLRDARADVPEVLDHIYLRMVAKQPSERFATMTDVVLAVEEATRTLSALGMSTPGPRPPSPAMLPSESTMDLASARQLTDHGSEPRVNTSPHVTASPTVVAPPSALPTAPYPSSATQIAPPSMPVSMQPISPTGAAGAAAAHKPHSYRALILGVAAVLVLLGISALVWWQLQRGDSPQTGRRRPPGAFAKQDAGDPKRSERDTRPQTSQHAPADSSPTPKTNSPKPAEVPPKQGPFAGAILNGGGSTFVDPLMRHWAGVYEQGHGVRVDYQGVGSGRGIEGVLNRVYLFGCSDTPLTDQQLAKVRADGGEVIHVPLVLGAVVPAYNLPSIGTTQLRFTGPILAGIFLGKITKWNDPALKIANPGVALPDMAITPVHRADKSGTTHIWTNYLSSVSGEWKSRFGAAMLLDWPAGLEGKFNNGVANQVSRTVGSLGYLELSYALENSLSFGQVKNREGKFIPPTLESVTAAAGALVEVPADLRLPLIDAPGDDAYPIVGMAYAIVHTDQRGNPAGRELVGFLRWATHEGQAYVKELRYAPLPPELVQRIDAALATIKLASK